MVTKKTEKANLENKKSLFFEIGMAISIAIVLMAVEIRQTKSATNQFLAQSGFSVIEEMTEITRSEVIKQVVPPPIPEIKIVEDHSTIEEDPLDWLDPEIKTNEAFVPIYWEAPVEPPDPTETIIDFADQMPRYRKGGLDRFHQFIQSIVKYPQEAIDNQLEGKVFVKFVVDRKGNVKNIEIVRSVHPLLDNEVISAIKRSEVWEPGMQNGLPVNVAMTMPISFVLNK